MSKRWKAIAYIKDTRPEGERSPRGRVRLGNPAVIVTDTPGEALTQMEEYLSELVPDLQNRVVQIVIRADDKPGTLGNPLLVTPPQRRAKKKSA